MRPRSWPNLIFIGVQESEEIYIEIRISNTNGFVGVAAIKN